MNTDHRVEYLCKTSFAVQWLLLLIFYPCLLLLILSFSEFLLHAIWLKDFFNTPKIIEVLYSAAQES